MLYSCLNYWLICLVHSKFVWNHLMRDCNIYTTCLQWHRKLSKSKGAECWWGLHKKNVCYVDATMAQMRHWKFDYFMSNLLLFLKCTKFRVSSKCWLSMTKFWLICWSFERKKSKIRCLTKINGLELRWTACSLKEWGGWNIILQPLLPFPHPTLTPPMSMR